jgi:neutral ceramidase
VEEAVKMIQVTSSSAPRCFAAPRRALPGFRAMATLALAVLAAFLAGMAVPPLRADEDPAGSWKAGVASATITPRQPMWMAGYAARNKPSEGTAQDLFAKALALEDEEGNRAVIVTMDLIGVLTTLRENVEKAVEAQYKLPPAALLLCASHTHCGPEYRPREGREEEAREYQRFLEETLVRLVGQAIEGLAPAELASSRARAGFAMNRRRLTERGYRILPNPDGPVDHDVPVLIVRDLEGGLRAVLFGYACHNTTLGFYEFCGDYAGYAQEYFEADHPGATAMFVAGCGADQNPYPRNNLTRAQQHGRTLATAVEAALDANPRPVRGRLRCALENVVLDRTGERAGPFPYPVQVFRFGESVTLVALASEVVVDYSLRLKREIAGDSMVWVAAYANGYFGYIPSRRVLDEGGYEAGPWEPSLEDRIVEKVHQLNRQLQEE